MTVKLWIQIVIGTVGYSAWACMALFDHALLPDFLKFNMAMALGTIGLALRDMPPAGFSSGVRTTGPKPGLSVEPQADSQTGYAKPALLGLVALGMASLILAAHPEPAPLRASPLLWCHAYSGDGHCH